MHHTRAEWIHEINYHGSKRAQLKTEGDENQGLERPSDFLKVIKQTGNRKDWWTEVGLAVR